MKTFVAKLFRDPIWGSIGALAAVVALLLVTQTPKGSLSELSLVLAYGFVPVTDLPKDFVFKERGTDTEFPTLHYGVFLIINLGETAIRAEDFWEPISIRPKIGSIIRVEPCQRGDTFGIANIRYGWNAPTTTSRSGSDWIVSTTGLNAGDVSCVVVFVQIADMGKFDENLVDISARVKDANVKYYSSLLDLPVPSAWSIERMSNIRVVLEGKQVYFFAVLQAILFFLTYKIAARTGFLSGSSAKISLLLVFIALLSSSSAQNLIALQVLDFRFIHAALWITSGLHLSFIIFLIARAYLRSQSPGEG